jgi:release factor glutamine methyltransferase
VTGTISWRDLQVEAVDRLRSAGVQSPDVDARRIVERASGEEGAALVLALDAPVTERAIAYFDGMLARRAAGEPLQYVLGSWGFRTLDLYLDRRVLIPRPETEVVAGLAIDELDRVDGATVVDLGTGSGAIALAIAVERPRVAVWASDADPEALEVARGNLAGAGRAATRVRLAEGSWFGALPDELRGAVDVVVSNPPYVAAGDPLPPEVADWEPRRALIPGPTGLEAIEVIVAHAPEWLARPGALVVEIGETQGDAVRALAEVAGFEEMEIRPDLAGRPRALVARYG